MFLTYVSHRRVEALIPNQRENLGSQSSGRAQHANALHPRRQNCISLPLRTLTQDGLNVFIDDTTDENVAPFYARTHPYDFLKAHIDRSARACNELHYLPNLLTIESVLQHSVGNYALIVGSSNANQLRGTGETDHISSAAPTDKVLKILRKIEEAQKAREARFVDSNHARAFSKRVARVARAA